MNSIQDIRNVPEAMPDGYERGVEVKDNVSQALFEKDYEQLSEMEKMKVQTVTVKLKGLL
jgi:hypothetical protein